MTANGNESLLTKLQAALRADGDFPIRARIVSELRRLANDENSSVNQISELILREPSLGTRVLHLVNSGYYRRSAQIVTISQAVMQLGMKSLAELCAGLVLIHKFLPNARRGGIFADGIKRTVLTSLASSLLAAPIKEEGISERAYLAGTFYNLGYLLLGFYFPQVYEAAAKRAAVRGHDITQSITELIGIQPSDLNMAIINSLEIPEFYQEVLVEAHKPGAEPLADSVAGKLALVVRCSGSLARLLTIDEGVEPLNALVDQLARDLVRTPEEIAGVVRDLSEHFKRHVELIELSFLTLPPYVAGYQYGQKGPENQTLLSA